MPLAKTGNHVEVKAMSEGNRPENKPELAPEQILDGQFLLYTGNRGFGYFNIPGSLIVELPKTAEAARCERLSFFCARPATSASPAWKTRQSNRSSRWWSSKRMGCNAGTLPVSLPFASHPSIERHTPC